MSSNSETNLPDRAALVEFMKRISPIKHEPLATAVAEEWAGNFVDEFYPTPKPAELTAGEYYMQWQDEAVDTIQSALFEEAGWSSEHYSAQIGKYRRLAEDIGAKLFGDPIWSLLGFAIKDLEEGAENAE